MKIAIITWCSYQNFGTYLQAYAMQWQLRQMGHEAVLIDDSIYTTNVYCSKKTRLLNWCKRCIKVMIPSFRRTIRNDQVSLELYKSFRDKWLDIDQCIEPLNLLDERYDCYVCGSDQIWNSGCLATTGKDFFFASFSHKPKIAYAPSGLVNYPQIALAKLANLIKDFTYLSVREAEAAPIIHNLTGKEIAIVVDPTLLISKDVWNELLSIKHFFHRPYILLYLLSKNEAYVQAAKQYAIQKGVSLKIIHSIFVNHGEHTIPAGPSEFLSLVKNAEMIMTDSFHGTIFAIKFHRPFITFQRFHANEENSQNYRIINLLNMVGLSDRLIDVSHLGKIKSLCAIDFDVVDKRLFPSIEYSKAYLDNALESVCNG